VAASLELTRAEAEAICIELQRPLGVDFDAAMVAAMH